MRPLVDKLVERGRRGLLQMEELCFSSREPREIWQGVSDLVARVLGVDAISVYHYSVSIGAVLGLELADGRRIAVKVFPPWHDRRFLVAANEVRRRLRAEGYPAPRALTAVESFGAGHVWIEEWLEAPPARSAVEVIVPLAVHLADFLQRCAPLDADEALAGSWQTFERPVGIWRNPPRPDADLSLEVADSEWVREIAEFGRSIADVAPGPRSIGHVDWRPDNARIDPNGSLVAVFDWDSVQFTHHVHVLGGACSGLPPGDMARFLAAYEEDGGQPLSYDERRAVAGRVIWSRAMSARFELVRRLPEADLRVVPSLKSDVDNYLHAATAAN